MQQRIRACVVGETDTRACERRRKRVKVAIGSTTTVYIGNYYEKNTSTGVITKYYFAGGQRVSMRAGSTLYYLFSALPTYPKRSFSLQEIWNAYVEVYGEFGHQDWLNAIRPYFESLGVVP